LVGGIHSGASDLTRRGPHGVDRRDDFIGGVTW